MSDNIEFIININRLKQKNFLRGLNFMVRSSVGKKNIDFILILITLLFILTMPAFAKPSTPQNWKSVAAGENHSLAISSTGELWGWGRNDMGQLGDGTRRPRIYPVRIGLDSDWKYITAGYDLSAGIKNDGTLWVWGDYSLGRDKEGLEHYYDRITPQKIVFADSNLKVKSISVGRSHILAVLEDGTLWTWGSNKFGQLGDKKIETDKGVYLPHQLLRMDARYSSDTDWSWVTAGEFYTAALKKDGTLWVWGDNTFSQLGNFKIFNEEEDSDIGDNGIVLRPEPQKLRTDTPFFWNSISAGKNHVLAISNSKQVWTWGNNISLPMLVDASANWISASAGADYSMAMKSDGSLWTWGNSLTQNVINPVQIGEINKWITIGAFLDPPTFSAGGAHLIGIQRTVNTEVQTLWAWGNSAYGQVGNGLKDNINNVPIHITGDITPPHIILTIPYQNQNDKSVHKPIVVKFDEDVKPNQEINNILIKDAAGNIVDYTLTSTYDEFEIQPRADLEFSTVYRVYIPAGSVQDLVGNDSNDARIIDFTTASAPVVISVDPPNESRSVPVNKVIMLTFNRNLIPGSNFNQISLTPGGIKPGAIFFANNIVSIVPNDYLTNGVAYQVYIPKGAVWDTDENPTSQSYNIDFTASLAPTWTNGEIVANGVSNGGVFLTWTGASNNTSNYLIYKNDVYLTTVSENSYYVAGLSTNQTYKFNVQAANGTYVSTDGPIISVPPVTSNIPGWVTSCNITQNGLTLNWSSVDNSISPVRYKVYNGNNLITTTRNKTSNVTGLEAYTEYTFKIIGVNADGSEFVYSAPYLVRTADVTVPYWDAGVSIAPTVLTENSITISWQDAHDNIGVENYRVYLNNDPIALTIDKTITFSGLQVNKSYSIDVEAGDAAGNWSRKLNLLQNTADTHLPTWKNATIDFENLIEKSVTLSWEGATDNVTVVGYKVYYSDKIIESQKPAVDIVGLAPNTIYQFKIEAVDEVGNVSIDGPDIPLKTSDVTKPAWPNAKLNISYLTNDGLTLNWSNATDNDKVAVYKVYQDSGVLATVSNTTYDVTGLTEGKAYTFNVEAGDPTGNWSNDGPQVIPAWNIGSKISVTDVTYRGFKIGWPIASNATSNALYRIFLNGNSVASTTYTSYVFSSLNPGLTCLFAVYADDKNGNFTILSGVYSTKPDTTQPTWTDAVLAESNITQNSVKLSWAGANDEVGVMSYRIYNNDIIIGNSSSQTYTATGLSAGKTYNFKIQAGDISNNWSTNGPNLSVTTKSATSSGGGSSGGGSSSSSSSSSSSTTEDESALFTTNTVKSGTTDVTIFAVNDQEALDKYNKNDDNILEIPITLPSAKVITQISSNLINRLADIEEGGMIRIDAGSVAYELPLSEINLDKLALEINESESNINMFIEFNRVDSYSQLLIQKYLTKNALSQVVTPIEFTIEAVGDKRRTTLNKFTKYISREITLSGSVDTSSATAVVLNSDGSLTPVPTTFHTKDGNTIAVIKRNTNSVYTIISTKKTFKDLQKQWAKQDIEVLASKTIIAGYSKNLYSPWRNITRGDLAAYIARGLGLGTSYAKLFKDTNTTMPYAGDLSAAASAGIIGGFSNGTFKPKAYATREEVAAIMVRALHYAGKDTSISDEEVSYYLNNFKDKGKIAVWARKDVATAVKNGVLGGFQDKTFKPKDNTTRAQGAAMIRRLLNQVSFL